MKDDGRKVIMARSSETSAILHFPKIIRSKHMLRVSSRWNPNFPIPSLVVLSELISSTGNKERTNIKWELYTIAMEK